jgi:hypothetical protein
MPKPVVPSKTIPGLSAARVAGAPAPAPAKAAKPVAVAAVTTPVALEKKARVHKPLLTRLERMVNFSSIRLLKLNKFASKMKGEATEEQTTALETLQDVAANLATDIASAKANLAFLIDTKFVPAKNVRQVKASKLEPGQTVIIKDKFYNEADFGSNGDLSVVEVGERMVTLEHGLNSKAPQIKVPLNYVVAVAPEAEDADTEDNAEVEGEDNADDSVEID